VVYSIQGKDPTANEFFLRISSFQKHLNGNIDRSCAMQNLSGLVYNCFQKYPASRGHIPLIELTFLGIRRNGQT